MALLAAGDRVADIFHRLVGVESANLVRAAPPRADVRPVTIAPRAPEIPAVQAPPVSAPAPESRRDKDPDILALEETLSENLGLKVSIDDRGQSGQIMIAYDSLEQLD